MKTVLISGAHGLLGTALCEHLNTCNVEVFSINYTESIYRIHSTRGSSEAIIEFSKEQLSSNKILDQLENVDILGAPVVHCAWKGVNGLTGGTFFDQIRNVEMSCRMFDLAKLISSSALINVGSMEEVRYKKYIKNFSFKNENYYGFCKNLVDRYMRYLCYSNSIRYIHCMPSIILSNDLRKEKFVETQLRSIKERGTYQKAVSHSLCSLISAQEASKQIVHLILHGKNLGSYPITGDSIMTLNDYFSLVGGRNIQGISGSFDNPFDKLLCVDDFDHSKLTQDLNYIKTFRFLDFWENIV